MAMRSSSFMLRFMHGIKLYANGLAFLAGTLGLHVPHQIWKNILYTYFDC